VLFELKLTYQQSLFISSITVTNISQSFYLQDGGKKSTGIDVEQNYVTVTLCIQMAGCKFLNVL